MSAGHTPGPWHTFASGWAKERGQVEINADDGLTVAYAVTFVPSYRATSEANARLLAAAPEMLEALEAWQTYDSRDDSGPNAGVQMMLDYDRALTLTRAAIAKARGEA